MQIHTAQPGGWLQYAVLVFVAGILTLRAWRTTQLRPLKIDRLWIVPALYFVVVASLFISAPPTPVGWAICVAVLLLGAAIGWQRGKTMQIHVDSETHAINQKGSMAAVLFLVALFAVRFAAQTGGAAFYVKFAVLSHALAALALGLFAVTRLEMYLRATRLLQEARAARA